MTYLSKDNTLHFYSREDVQVKIDGYETIHTDKPFKLMLDKKLKLSNIPFKLNK